ncbi:DUF3941 domain-containing protein [Priestia aryabhattai]
MPKTSDNDKKAKDNNAKLHEKNLQAKHNRELGKYSFSKKTDHL